MPPYKVAATEGKPPDPGNSWQLALAVSSGILFAVLLLVFVMMFRWKGPFKKSRGATNDRRAPRATESTDTTPYPTQNNDKDGLVNAQQGRKQS